MMSSSSGWRFLELFVRPFYLWVSSRIINEQQFKELALDPNLPIVYVLQKRSITDLLVLFRHLRRARLPFPNCDLADAKRKGAVSIMFMWRPGLIQADRSRTPEAGLRGVVRELAKRDDFDVQLVPVSIFWGKHPGSEERSILRLLFVDELNASLMQKLFIVMAQGRNVLVNFGLPLRAREMLDGRADTEDQVARKLQRVLKVHFINLRNQILGRKQYVREQVVRRIVKSKAIQEVLRDEMAKNRISLEAAEEKAKRYVREIAADQSYPVVKAFEIALAWIWNKIFDGVRIKNLDMIHELSKTHEIIYVPNHRSHLDYLLVNYTVYSSGLPSPHTAAGINLNFWPMGGLLRRAGGFFLRRSFGGNRLYTAVFNEYIHYLITHGYPLSFFPEGGRSRTGRLLVPKTGMLSMVVHSFVRSPDRPVALVPMYIGYDKVVEVRSYVKELAGSRKTQENARQLLEARKVLKRYYGKAYMGVGEPVLLGDYLDDKVPVWRESVGHLEKPAWMGDTVQDLARSLVTRINQATIVSPVSILGLILLAVPQRAVPIEDLLAMADVLIKMQRAIRYDERIELPEGDFASHLQRIERLKSFQRFQHVGGDVIYLSDFDATLITYYRNNVLHLFALPSLIARLFNHNEEFRRQELADVAMGLYDFVKDEFFLPWSRDQAREVILDVVEAMVGVGLLDSTSDDRIRRPKLGTPQYGYLGYLGRALGLVWERYMITATLLARNAANGYVHAEEFEQQCQKMAQRIAILNGVSNVESVDKALIKNYLALLKRMGFVETQGDTLLVKPEIERLASHAELLLSTDTRHSIERIASQSSKGPSA